MRIIGDGVAISTDNFGEIISSGAAYVDKSLLIREIIDDHGKAILITRPRRFGKTLNMSLLQHFFAAEVSGLSTANLFDKLAISQINNGEYIKEYQGKYPVVFISFSDIKDRSYEAAVSRLIRLIRALYREHRKVLDSGALAADEIAIYNEYLLGKEGIDGNLQKLDEFAIADSLIFITSILAKVYQQKVILLIDEYDTPLTSAYNHNYLELMSDLMRSILSPALKGNPNLYKGILTGILRVSKNNMLSGLNNLAVYTIFDNEYSSHFGFNKHEVSELLKRYSLSESEKQVKNFYNGYQIGNNTVYNPWSVMNFIKRKQLQPYWVMTSNDQVLRKLLVESSSAAKKLFVELLRGNKITATISLNMRYDELIEREYALWTLLLFTGYLSPYKKELTGSQYLCELGIPNKEIIVQYTETFSYWLQDKIGSNYTAFIQSLVDGRADIFTRELSQFLLRSVSVHDVAGQQKAESFYHGFVIGLIASIQRTHIVFSNRESGMGRYDLILIPNNSDKDQAILMEFKSVDRDSAMQESVENALSQIDQKYYAAELEQYPYIKQVLKVGLVFSQKSVASAWKITDLINSSDSEVEFGQIIGNE